MTEPKALNDLGWPTLVDHWARRCATSRGEAHVRGVQLFDAIDDARARAAEVTEARGLASRDAALPLGGISDVASAIARVRKSAALDAPELVAVASTGRALARLRAHLREHSAIAPRLASRAEAISDLGHVYHPILEAFDPDGRLVDHASDALGPLRRALAAIRSQLEKRMGTLLTDERFAPYLQDGYYTQREERYVLPIRTDGKGFVSGIVHGTSQSGQTLFIEPEEIVDLNNRAKLAEADVLDEERRIFVKFSGWIAEEADGFDAALAAAELLDVVAAAAIMADDTVASEPILDESPRVALLHARHPLMLLAERRCVANDITVPAGSTLLISGPNAGGKTVALKTTGLAALMARAGLHLTAESGSAMGWFPDVRTDIGDAQSLEHDLSTFSGHMVNLRDLIATAGRGSLVLIDEIAVGTDPDQGAALAQAVLEALADRGVTSIVTTHYERLKALGALVDAAAAGAAAASASAHGTAVDDAGAAGSASSAGSAGSSAIPSAPAKFSNASVGFDLGRLEPTFKLHLGVPGSSGALAVARRMGIPAVVVERARELMGAQVARVEDLLASVADQRRRLEEERAALLAELEAAESDRAASRANRERSAARFEKQTRAAHGEALAALKAARREIDEIRRDLKRRAAEAEASVEDVKEATRRLATPGTVVAKHEPKRSLPPGTPATAEQMVQGAPVLVPRLGRAEVVSMLPDDKVEVRVGAMRAIVPLKDVLIDSHRRAARRAAASSAESGSPSSSSSSSPAFSFSSSSPSFSSSFAAGSSASGAGAGPSGPHGSQSSVALVDGVPAGGRANARTVDTTLDVRGNRVDEAITQVDRFVDESLLAGRDAIFVVHGHGTGALRSAVRTHLQSHGAIDKFRPGEQSEGGDGVTVAFLKG